LTPIDKIGTWLADGVLEGTFVMYELIDSCYETLSDDLPVMTKAVPSDKARPKMPQLSSHSLSTSL